MTKELLKLVVNVKKKMFETGQIHILKYLSFKIFEKSTIESFLWGVKEFQGTVFSKS